MRQGDLLSEDFYALADISRRFSNGQMRSSFEQNMAMLGKLDLLAELNHEHAAARPEQTELDARIRNYELAFRMQASAPEAVDLADETEETLRLYGLDDKDTAAFGRLCLLSRRLVERRASVRCSSTAAAALAPPCPAPR